MRRIVGLTLLLGIVFTGSAAAEKRASLRGSPASMIEQNTVAREHGLPFYRTTREIRLAVERGELVELTGNRDYAVADFVTLPYLHPAAHLFVERLAAQYREACGQKLVVTSAVRPINGQPANAHRLSVHPAGMAIDLRVSDRAACRGFLESAILSLESRGLLNGIREYRPPHYHIALYPEPYLAYVQERLLVEQQAVAAEAARGERDAELPAAGLTESAAQAFVAPAVAAEPGRAADRAPLQAALFLLLALPLGLGFLLRRRRR